MERYTVLPLFNPNIKKNINSIIEFEENYNDNFFYKNEKKELIVKSASLITTHSTIWGTIALIPALSNPVTLFTLGVASILVTKERVEEILALNKEKNMIKSIKFKDYLKKYAQ